MQKAIGMKRLFLTLALVSAAMLCVKAQSRSLLYEVKWKWGLVDMSAGMAHLTTEQVGDAFSANLSGHSIPWEGRIYRLDETLRAVAAPDSLQLQYINGVYSKPRVHARNAHPAYKDILGQGTLNASPKTMEAVSVMAHMLGLYYYAGVIDFDSMAPGDFKDIPYLHDSGTESVLQIEYTGCSNDCYLIKFKFSFCPYRVDCAIDKTSRIPRSFSAEIAIGHVEMNLYE